MTRTILQLFPSHHLETIKLHFIPQSPLRHILPHPPHGRADDAPSPHGSIRRGVGGDSQFHGLRRGGRNICDYLIRGALVTDYRGEEEKALEGKERVLGAPGVGEGQVDEEAVELITAVDGVSFRAGE